jgi:hypothetical protein
MMGNIKTRLTKLESWVLKGHDPGKGILRLLAWDEDDDDPEVTWSGPQPTTGIAALFTAEEWQRLTEKEAHLSG